MALTTYVDSYCAVADVQRELKQRTISASSTVTTTDVETYIKRRFHLINGMLVKAGYVVPVTQGGVATLTPGTQLESAEAAVVDQAVITLQDSDGSLTGKVQQGDVAVFDSQSQVYVITGDSLAGDNEITVNITPGLLATVALGEDVTYTSVQTPTEILEQFNAVGAALDTVKAGFSGANAKTPQQAEDLKKVWDMFFDGIKDGEIDLVGAERNQFAAPRGTVRIGR